MSITGFFCTTGAEGAVFFGSDIGGESLSFDLSFDDFDDFGESG